jgi:uncharacterized membrane protein HdeD (DUF308 family)
MMIKALVLFLGAFLVILGYEYVYHKFYKNRQVPLSLGFFLVFCIMVFRVSSACIGALVAVRVFPPAGRTDGRITAAIGLLAGLWSASVLVQLAQNAVRVLIGEPTRPVSLIRLSSAWKK